MRRALFVLYLGALIGGCAGVREPIAGPDAPPPPGYAPVFVNKIQPYTPSVPAPFITVTRTQIHQARTVRVYAHVLDSSGVLYTGLASKEWQKLICEVTDEINGRTKSVEYRLSEVTVANAEPLALALVLDHSGSMGDARAFALQDAALRLIAQKRPKDEIALVKFDNHIEVESLPSTSQADLMQRLRRVGLRGFGGLTAIVDGAKAGLDALAASRAPNKAVLVFTDGYDNSSRMLKDSLVTQAQALGIPICTIGFGYSIDEDYLRSIASATGGIYQRIYRTDEFSAILPSVYALLENYVALDVQLKEYGVHRIRIKLCPPKPAPESIAEIALDNTPDVGSIGILYVYFDTDKADLKPESKPALDNIEVLLRAYPAMVIEVRGHTDSTGNADYNLRLSERRANAVRTELVRRGIQPDRIRGVGFGSSQPIADNRTPEGRALNRRTEFVILRR
ncbi:MAG: OmpA family protein [Chlorobi bacterium]|nr:OmpA family protein [Chlorobiota bacterium]